jgi:hypothetical protein
MDAECIVQTVPLAFKTLERLLVMGPGHVVWVHRRSFDAVRASVMAQYGGLIVSVIVDAMDKYVGRGEN